VKNPVEQAILSHRIVAGLGMVLLAVVWAIGWFTPGNPFKNAESPGVQISLTAAVFVAWNLLAAVIAAGFFHAASVHPAKLFGKYRRASLFLVVIGIVLLFPVPIMAQILGTSPLGRAYALLITGMSIAAIVFGRARLRLIQERLAALSGCVKTSLAPIEDIDQIGETD
jgi:hypothetical protein